MTGDYWTEFWKSRGQDSQEAHPQSQILRTCQRQPVDPQTWTRTLNDLLGQLDLKGEEHVLDLCGGNGLIASFLSTHCKKVTVVDISPDFVSIIEHTGGQNVTPIVGDMRTIEFEPCTFDRVLCYAALQYLSYSETSVLMPRIYDWLKPGGLCFLGDIPDQSRIWHFFDDAERRRAYFDGLRNNEPIVGTWFEREWLERLIVDSGFSTCQSQDQPDYQIYAWFRFDLRAAK